jgi:hypothetical protein
VEAILPDADAPAGTAEATKSSAAAEVLQIFGLLAPC